MEFFCIAPTQYCQPGAIIALPANKSSKFLDFPYLVVKLKLVVMRNRDFFFNKNLD